jgi:uncharacterized protein YecA (UPF0149 family)
MILAGGGTEDKDGNKENTIVIGQKSDKVGRNDPCPCGARKSDGTLVKYKHCHGK